MLKPRRQPTSARGSGWGSARGLCASQQGRRASGNWHGGYHDEPLSSPLMSARAVSGSACLREFPVLLVRRQRPRRRHGQTRVRPSLLGRWAHAASAAWSPAASSGAPASCPPRSAQLDHPAVVADVCGVDRPLITTSAAARPIPRRSASSEGWFDDTMVADASCGGTLATEADRASAVWPQPAISSAYPPFHAGRRSSRRGAGACSLARSRTCTSRAWRMAIAPAGASARPSRFGEHAPAVRPALKLAADACALA